MPDDDTPTEGAGYASPDELDDARSAYETQMEAVASSTDDDDDGAQAQTAFDAGGVPVAPDEANQMTLRRRGPVCVRDHTGEPLRGEPYSLIVNGAVATGTTDEQGFIGWFDTSSVDSADLYVAHVAYHLTFTDGDADGWALGQSILNAIGYSAGPLDGDAGPRTKSAISYYQIDRGLEVTGELDDATLAQLKTDHVIGGEG
jgi:hypothetical protein